MKLVLQSLIFNQGNHSHIELQMNPVVNINVMFTKSVLNTIP